MNDKELSDKIVSLGVGWQGKYPLSVDGVGFYHEPDSGESMCAKLFVRDWRVTGALIERCEVIAATKSGNSWFVSDSWNFTWSKGNESLPRAICEACVETLANDSGESLQI